MTQQHDLSARTLLKLRDPLPHETLQARTARTLREEIMAGRWPEQSRLPGHKQLAAQLGVSRNTLVAALTQLQAEGYVEVQGRSGTRVAKIHAPQARGPLGAPLALSAWAQRALAGQIADAGARYRVDFRLGQPVSELYPARAWGAALAARAAHSVRPEADPLGPLYTRRALAAYLTAERGAVVNADMILLTSGTQSSLDALARLFLEAGRRAAVEDPSYPPARATLAATGAELFAVPTDEAGLRPQDLPTSAHLLYLTPDCQYPTTAALPIARRKAVIAWAKATGALILEDDYAADLCHAGRPLQVMQALAPESVVLLGTFSKSLAPVTRSGYLVAPPEVIEVLAATRPLTDRLPSSLDALALADLLTSGQYARHLRRVQPLLAHRAQVLHEQLALHFPRLRRYGGRSGLHLLLRLPAGEPEEPYLAAAAAAGVGLTPLSAHVWGPQATQHHERQGLLLAFAHLSPEQIRIGIRLWALSCQT